MDTERLADASKTLLASDPFNIAFSKLREETVSVILSSSENEKDMRESAYHLLKALERIENKLNGFVSDGSLLAHKAKMNQPKVYNE